MDQLFGDSTTAMPTPALHAEVESLMSAGRSPVSSLDIRRGPGIFTADSAIPGLDIDPPLDGADKQAEDEAGPRSEGIGGWISRLTSKPAKEAGRDYRRLGQDDE